MILDDSSVELHNVLIGSVNINARDILKWIDSQENPTILRIIRRYAYSKINDLENESKSYNW